MPPDALATTPPERRRGHADGSVLCLAFAHDGQGPASASTSSALEADAHAATHQLPLLASGGEDGAVCLHDLRCPPAGPPAARAPGVAAPDEDGVTALAWSTRSDALYAAAGRRVVRLDARLWGAPAGPPGLGPASGGALVHTAADDVGGLARCVAGAVPSLAIADDSGTVALLTCAGGGGHEARPLLPPAHTNLAGAVVGRPGPARTGEVVSGGFDCIVSRWDAASRRLVARWEVSACVALARAAAAAEGEEGGACAPAPAPAPATPSLNPPFVHALAAPPAPPAGTSPLAGLVAAALGDGSVLLLDVDAVAGTARAGGGAGSAAAPRGRRGVRAVRAGAAGRAPGPDPRLLPPGVLGALTHAPSSRAATALAFTSASDDVAAPWLASGGDDGRVAVWAWRAGCGAAAVSAGGSGRGRGRAALWAAEVGGAAGRPPLLASVDNGRKVQALAAGPGGLLAVGDTGRRVGVFRVGE